MVICYSLSHFNSELSLITNNYKIGFVPTMGALHQGHISLVKKAHELSDIVVVSIFVNPTQFNNPQDLERYPRTVEEDCKRLEEAGANLVFVPSVGDIYPQKDERIFDLGGLDAVGEGPRRPGHFNGVAQVVTRLFDIVKPRYAYFGEKDFQQLSIIRHFTKELNYPVEIISCPTIREEDGLAMSSRNSLLTPEHREAAPLIYKTLKTVQERSQAQILSPDELCKWVTDEINSNSLLKTEYVEIVNSLTLRLVKNWSDHGQIQMCVAVFAGTVRLIDNIKLK